MAKLENLSRRQLITKSYQKEQSKSHKWSVWRGESTLNSQLWQEQANEDHMVKWKLIRAWQEYGLANTTAPSKYRAIEYNFMSGGGIYASSGDI